MESKRIVFMHFVRVQVVQETNEMRRLYRFSPNEDGVWMLLQKCAHSSKIVHKSHHGGRFFCYVCVCGGTLWSLSVYQWASL